MAKVTLTDLTSLANDTSATNSINENFQTLEDYINDNVLSRDTGAETNTMQNDIDMNSYDLLNVAEINGVSFADISSASTDAAAAAASAAAALVSEGNAATSETNAAASAAAAAISEANATAIVGFDLADQNTWAATQVASTYTNATATGNLTLDFDTYQNFILTLTGNLTLDNPSTELTGATGFIVFKQSTGSHTLTLGSQYLNAGGTAPTLTTTASAIDVIPYIVSGSGEILLGTPLLEFS